MPLQIPTRLSVVQNLQAYTRRNLPDLDPTVTRRRGFIGGFIRSLGSALHDWYVALKRYADYEPFPQTATEGFFQQGWWIDITNLQRNPAAAAQGYIVLTGDNGTIVPAGTELTSASASYLTETSVTVLSQSLIGESIGYQVLVGRFVTVEPHNLADGMTATFSGCVDASLNGTFEIRVVDANTIEYDLDDTLTGTPLEPNPVMSATWANVLVTCTTTGPGGNIDSGSSLSVTSPPTGLDGTALVTFGGVADGSGIETIEDWRARVLEALGTDFGMFSADEIRIVAKTVPGVTRVFVREPKRYLEDEDGNQIFQGVGIDGYPVEGRVRIAFLRDNDSDPIPSALEVAQVDAVIQALRPAHTLAEDVEVLAPERYALEVRFHSIAPDTPGMRASVRAQILQFLRETATWGGTLEIDGLRCAIRGAFDAETGQALTSYSLDTPTMDIALPVDAYPVLSGITWRVTT